MTQCYGFQIDCCEDATTKVTAQSGNTVNLCADCAEEYQNYLVAISWKLVKVQ